jgi:phospholipid/cholesterol/gamma-HCH transport system substrate-binding protein
MKLKDDVAVGAVVIAALLVMLVGGYWLTGRPWSGGRQELTATFRAVGTLTEGNKVKYRGVTVGRVEKIALAPRGDGVYVTMTVEPGLRFPPDAAVLLSPESFFGEWQAEIISQKWQPDLEFTYATQPGVLPGTALPDISELTAVAARIAGDIEVLSDRVQIAFTRETAVKIRETVENVNDMSAQLAGFVDKQTHTFDQVSANALAASANVRDATDQAKLAAGDLRGTLNGGDVQQILANARQASENLNRFSAQLNAAGNGLPTLMSRADTTLASVSRTADELNQTMTTLRPQLEQVGPTLAEAQKAMQTLQRALATIEEGNGTLGRLVADPALYEETQRAVVTMRRLLADIQANPGKYVGQLQIF